MKLFTPLALSLGTVSAEDSCGAVSVTVERTIRQIYHFGDYPTGFENYATDWKASFLASILDGIFTAKYSAAASLIPGASLGDVTCYDLKNDFMDCNVGMWCTEMNLQVTIPLSFTFSVDLPCEGSADMPDDVDQVARMGGLDLSGIEINIDTDVDITIDTSEIDAAIDDELDNDPPEEYNPETDDFEVDEGATQTEDSSTTTVTDEDGESVEIQGDCAGVDCECAPGYHGDLCTDDIDECMHEMRMEMVCGEDQDCTNIPGSYICTDSEAPAVCPDGFTGAFPDCVDVDECAHHMRMSPCGDNQSCTNTVGGYECSCVSGFESDGSGSCVDIDECAHHMRMSPCVNAICVNGEGAYSCDCFENYVQLPGFNTDVCHLQSSYECFDGSNGGCSHFCSTDGCGCPECWSLLSDGKTCVPSAEHLHVMCSANSMMMAVDECVYGTGESLTLGLAGGDCQASYDAGMERMSGGYWGTTTQLDACGTSVAADGDKIVFQNSMTVESRASAIVMHSDPDITFTCEYSSNVDGVSSSINVLGETHTAQGSTSDGTFEFTLSFVAPDKDGNFGTAADDTMIVGERVYFDVTNTNPINGVSFVVQDCEISDAHGNAHKIVDTNCLDSNTFVQRESPYETTIASDMARFSYTAFIFANSPDTDSASLDLVCNIAACLDGDCADIVNDCNARRRRRAIVPQSQVYQLKTNARFSDL